MRLNGSLLNIYRADATSGARQRHASRRRTPAGIRVRSSRSFVDGQISIEPYAERDCSLHCSPFVSVGQSEEGPTSNGRGDPVPFEFSALAYPSKSNTHAHRRTEQEERGRHGDRARRRASNGETIGRSTTRTGDEYAWPGKYIFQFFVFFFF